MATGGKIEKLRIGFKKMKRGKGKKKKEEIHKKRGKRPCIILEL